MAAVPFLSIVVAGWLFCRLLVPREEALGLRSANFPSCFGVGAVLLHVEFLLVSWGGPVALWHLLFVPTVLAGLVCFITWGRTGKRRSDNLPSWSIMAVLGLLLCVQIFSLIPLCSLPLFDWEGRMLWALKSRFLEESASVVAEPFRDPYRLHAHPRYPLLVPWFVSVVSRVVGGYQEFQYLLVILSFAVMTTWQLYMALLSRIGWRLALAFSLAFVAGSSWYTAEINQQVEIVLAFFVLTALCHLLAWLERHRWQDLVLAAFLFAGAALTKNEGVLIAIIACLACYGVSVSSPQLRRGRFLVLPVVIVALYAAWWFHVQAIPNVADENYLAQFSLGHFQQSFDRLTIVIEALVKQMLDYELWHVYWFVTPPCVLWIFITWRSQSVAKKLLALMWIAYVSCIMVIYLISPWRDIVLHIESSFNRVAIPSIPIGILLLGIWVGEGFNSASVFCEKVSDK